MGCHTGLPVDGDPAALTSNVANASGTAFIATTGYGYGDNFTVGLHERLLSLVGGQLDGTLSLGMALVAAKQEYFATSGLYGPYDEKVIESTVLYGFPMVRIGEPGQHRGWKAPTVGARQGTSSAAADVAFTQTAVGTVGVYDQATVDGVAFDPQVSANRPVLPRFDRDVTRVSPSGEFVPAHGVLITNLTDNTTNTAYDPVVPTAALQTSSGIERAFGTSALPARLARINTYMDVTGPKPQRRQRLVVVPARYRAQDTDASGAGQVDTYRRVEYQLQYSTSRDYTEPEIGLVRTERTGDHVTFRVRASDTAGIARVVVLVHTPTGWRMLDLTRTDQTWTTSSPIPTGSEYFVQAVDQNGNVGTANAKARYFTTT